MTSSCEVCEQSEVLCDFFFVVVGFDGGMSRDDGQGVGCGTRTGDGRAGGLVRKGSQAAVPHCAGGRVFV